MPQKLIKTLNDYQEIINRTPFMVFLWRILPDRSIEFVSDNVQKLLGYTAEDFISGRVLIPDITHPEDAPGLEAERTSYEHLGGQEFTQQYRLKTQSGEYRWFEDRTTVLVDEHGGATHSQSIFMDITERKLMEESLKENEAKFRTLFNLANDAIFLLYRDNIVDCNNKTLEMFGYTNEQIIGKTICDLSPPLQHDGRDSKEKAIEKINNTIYGEPQFFEWKHVRRDNTVFDAEVSLSRFKFKDNVFTQCIVRDVTYRKRMEEELVKSKNLESIGTLAGGIAHDFNNLLMVIMGNISLAKLHLSPDNKAVERLSDAENASIAAKDLTQQLITFSRGGEPWKKVIAVAPLIKSTTRFVLSGSRIKCKYFLSDGLHPIHADEIQLRQVIHNIMNNARESMQAGGIITIRADNVVIAQKDNIPLPNGDYVKISIEDKGIGIREEYINKIFDPYFSTKGLGVQKGMGLGLSVSYSIIKKHSGYILLESTLGLGTTVHIYLPAYRKEAEEAITGKVIPLKGRILVMDDVEEVRRVTSNMLIKLGYEVVCVEEGREAVELYKKAGKLGSPFDAVILDLTVQGGMGGKEALSELLSIDPYVKALIASGYSDNPIMDNFRKFGFKGAVIKPYKMEELEEALRRLLPHYP
jgi:two-component system, cell cycle sensor histidine kinase and response regulator CckA